jgi:hypothetical protein
MNKISVSQEKTLHTNHVNVFLNVKFNSYLFGHLMNSMWQSIEQIVQSEAIIQFEFFSDSRRNRSAAATSHLPFDALKDKKRQ